MWAIPTATREGARWDVRSRCLVGRGRVERRRGLQESMEDGEECRGEQRRCNWARLLEGDRGLGALFLVGDNIEQ